jgi:uncharacterized membrane protein
MTDLLMFLHITSAAIWVGGGFLLQVLMWRAQKLGPETVREFTNAAEWTSQRLFMPASFSALIFGVATVVSGGYDWGDPWIGIGFLGFILSALIGMAVLGPTSKRMKALIAERGPTDPVVTQLSRRIQNFGRIDLIILIAVVADMVFKPGL